MTLAWPDFWQRMTLVRRENLREGHETEAVAPLAKALASADEGAEFQACVDACLLALDSPAHRRIADEAMLSDDSFLYHRCYVVARGQAYFEAALDFPVLIGQPPEWCEPLLSLGAADGQPRAPMRTALQLLRLESDTVPSLGRQFKAFVHVASTPAFARTADDITLSLLNFVDEALVQLQALEDHAGLVDASGQTLQFLYDPAKNLYWGEVPVVAERASYGQEFLREALFAFLTRLPDKFEPTMFERPARLAW